MKIGIPVEIKPDENRVALTPSGALDLKNAGHEVFIQTGAGRGSGFTNESYEEMGAIIFPDIESVYRKADMVMKVKEPLELEYGLIREGQILFTYLHLASSEKLTKALIESGAVCTSNRQWWMEKCYSKLPGSYGWIEHCPGESGLSGCSRGF